MPLNCLKKNLQFGMLTYRGQMLHKMLHSEHINVTHTVRYTLPYKSHYKATATPTRCLFLRQNSGWP